MPHGPLTNSTQAEQLRQQDPELYALVMGTASAALEADAISGRLSPEPPDMKAAAEAERIRQINELAERATAGNQTCLFMLREMDPERAALIEQQSAPDPAALRAQAEDAAERDRSMRERSFQFAIAHQKAAAGAQF